MYTEDELKQLGIEEDELTEEELLLLLAALHTTLGEFEKEVRAFYQKYGKDGVVTYSEVKKWVSSTNHTKRLFFLNQVVSDLFETGFNAFETTFKSHLQDIVLKEAQFFGVELDVDEILDTVWGMDEGNWLQRLTAHRNKWTVQLNTDLKLSFLKRDSIIDVLTNVAKRGESMETILKRLFRTESNAVSSIARKKIYEILGVEKFRFLHLDGCTCELCSDMDGQVFPVSEYVVGVTANPLHPNCRDITEPIINVKG